MKKRETIEHFDSYAKRVVRLEKRFSVYHNVVIKILRRLIPPNKSVLDLGCGSGDKLASLKPAGGMGIDISSKMISLAKKRHPELNFTGGDAEKLQAGGEYEFIIAVNLMEYLQDIPAFCNSLERCSTPQTHICIINFNPFFIPFLKLLEMAGIKEKKKYENRMNISDVATLFQTQGFSLTKSGADSVLKVIQYGVYKLDGKAEGKRGYSCSVVIPCFNEENNVRECVRRIPSFSSKLEIIVVDDGSTDKTKEKAISLKDPRLKVISYPENRGKGYAVREGFNAAKGDVLIILDCDMTVPPEELPLFFDPIDFGRARAINGSRLVYQMEKQAMRLLNFYGNIFFGWAFSTILGKHITDTLCGTKAILKSDFRKIEMGKDPWGDFDILFGLAKAGIVPAEIPVHYKARIAGISKMKTFKHGFHLLKMCIRGFREIYLPRKFGKTRYK